MSERPARRFLHTCLNCDDLGAVVEFHEQGLALNKVMETPLEPSDGNLLGMDREIVAAAAFVYDHRGPRVSPSIEIQQWHTPTVQSRPLDDPTRVGMHALGYAVADLDEAVSRLERLGASVVGRGLDPTGMEWATLADPWGVRLDLTVDADTPADVTRLRHLRITVSDLAASLPWYERLGFDEIGRTEVASGSHLGLGGDVVATLVRLRLPDEPFEVLLHEFAEPAGHGRAATPANHAGLYRTAVGVDDTRASFEELRDEGVTFDREPQLVELNGTPVPDMWICFLSDPDGVPFEFVQRPRDAFR